MHSKAIEAAARALCAQAGHAPDDILRFSTFVSEEGEQLRYVSHDRVRWRDYIPAAEKPIAAYLAAMEAEGFVMVPVEPTDDMAFAGWDKIYEDSAPEDIYAAMLSTRPNVKG